MACSELCMIDGADVWLRYMLFSMSGWVNREQLKVIEYLKDENKILSGLIKSGRIRLSQEDRRRLGVKGRAIGRKNLDEVATIACADTILGWFRELVAKKWTYKRKGRDAQLLLQACSLRAFPSMYIESD